MAPIAPLDGVRVIEVSSWMAAPGAGAALADLGADVIKVEPPTGDIVRGLSRAAKDAPPLDHSFQADNRGKRSIAVDLTRPAGVELVRRLADGAEVFLCNLLPRRQRRFGLDPTTLQGRHRRLVHATLTGYGLDGPDAGRPGFDVTAFFGRGAITDAMTEPGGVAPQPRPAQGDHTAALAMVAAILAGLRVAERTGDGPVVDVNLMATAAWTMTTDLAPTLVDGREVTRRDRSHLIAPLANRFRCADDRWIILNMPEQRWWSPFCTVIGRPDLIDDPRFSTAKGRYDNMPEAIAALDAAFARHTLSEWGRRFDQAGLIWGPASSIRDLASDAQAEASGMFPTVEHPAGSFRTVGVPMRLSSVDIGPRGPAPGIGEHTREILSELGLSTAEADALIANGDVGPA
ncbi:MAG: CaiB/BaiF CoA transferase family protein [Desertimonas sp.]